jgi:hypothetical protein
VRAAVRAVATDDVQLVHAARSTEAQDGVHVVATSVAAEDRAAVVLDAGDAVGCEQQRLAVAHAGRGRAAVRVCNATTTASTRVQCDTRNEMSHASTRSPTWPPVPAWSFVFAFDV